MTDKQKILNWFKTNKYLDCATAIHKLGVYNLRSRASEIPGIVSELVQVIRKDGRKTQCARYSMPALHGEGGL